MAESTHITPASLPVLDLNLLSQSELYTISHFNASANNLHIDNDLVIPKIDRSVFNESAGSRKQTFSKLKLAPRDGKQKSSVTVPAPVPVPANSSSDEENSKIIDLLQQLFGVQSLRRTNDDGVAPLQIELKQPALELTPQAVQNASTDGVEGSQKKRKRRSNKKGTAVSETSLVAAEDKEKEAETVNDEKMVDVVNDKKGFVLDDVGDPFVEALIVKTQGKTTEAELMEFLEGLNGEWASDRKKRRIVDANAVCDLLPIGWKLVLILQRRGAHNSVVCRRYLSPDGRQFESYKDVSSYLVSSDSNINLTSENQSVGHFPTGGIKIDANASSHQLKQATMSSSIETEMLSTSDGNFLSNLALNRKLVGAIEASDTACNPFIPLDFTAPISNNSCDIDNFLVEGNAVTCIKGGVPFGNERVHVADNGLGLPVTLVEDQIQKIGSESSMLIPNSEGNTFAGGNLEDIHHISLVGFEKIEGNLVNEISTNGKLQLRSESSRVPPSRLNLNLNHTSIDSMNRAQTSVLKDSAEGNFFYNDLPSSSIDDSTWDHSGCINNISFSAWPQVASESGVNFTPNLYAANNVSDNHVPPMDEVATSYLQKRSSMNDQICTMDTKRSSESNFFTVTGIQHPSTFHDNMNNISAETFGALKHVDAGSMKPQGRSQPLPPCGNILNPFDKQNDGVAKGNKSCLSEMAKSEVEKYQTDSVGIPKFR